MRQKVNILPKFRENWASIGWPNYGILVITRGASGPSKKSGQRGATNTALAEVATCVGGRFPWDSLPSVRPFVKESVRSY